METEDPRSWPLLTNVEGLPLLGGHGHVRTRLRETHGVLFEIFYPAGVRSPEHRQPGGSLAHPAGVLHTVEALVDSRWLEFKSPPRAAWR